MSVLVNCLAVGAGGFIGSVARYLVGLLPAALGAKSILGGFPVATFSINVVGAFAIGFIAAWATRDAQMSPELLLLLKVGICGGFTTFSTFSLESMQLIDTGAWAMAVAYMVLSVIACLGAVLAGDALAGSLPQGG